MAVVIPRLPRRNNNSERRKERRSLYSRKDYKNFADYYKRKVIWCEACLRDGKFTPGRDLHHKISPFQGGLTLPEKLRLLMAEDNVEFLCDFHHRLEHHTASQREIEEYNRMIKKIKDEDNCK